MVRRGGGYTRGRSRRRGRRTPAWSTLTAPVGDEVSEAMEQLTLGFGGGESGRVEAVEEYAESASSMRRASEVPGSRKERREVPKGSSRYRVLRAASRAHVWLVQIASRSPPADVE